MRLTSLVALAAFPLLVAPALAQPIPCEDGFAGEYPCERVELLGHVGLDVFDSEAGNDSWGWTDGQTGREYALMALADGVGFVDVTDPMAPHYLGKLPTHTVPTIWRDVKVYADHAYIVSEAEGHGMQVFDLARLRSVPDAPMTFTADVHYDRIGQSHNIAINEETGFAYIVGSRAATGCAGGLHMVDIREPQRPTFAGCFAEDGYTHDVQCVIYRGPDTRHRGKEVCFASNEDTVTIVDVTDKAAPVMLGQGIYPNIAYTHQGWLTEDQRYFLANDELDEMRYAEIDQTRTLIFDVSDLEAPQFIAPHFSGVPAIDHNLYVRGYAVYMANYRSGLRIAEVGDLARGEMTNIGYFDTHPEDTETQFGGAWSTFPYFESGTVIISDMNRGLFLVRPYRDEPLAVTGLSARRDGATTELAWRLDRDDLEHVVVEREEGGRFVDLARHRTELGVMAYAQAVELAAGEHTLRLRGLDRDGFAVYSAPQVVTVAPAMSAR